MKLTLIISFLSLVTSLCFAQTTLFEQDFSSSTSVASYISSSPSVGQFNGFSSPSSSASIVNGTLQFDRPFGTTTGHFARSTDFSPIPRSLYIQMDFEVVSATTVAYNNALLFYIGSNFTSTVTNPNNTDTYARFGINFTGNGYEFSVWHSPVGGTGSFASSVFTGKKRLTFVLNNTGAPIFYLQPGGGYQQLSNDTYDLWVDQAEVFNGLSIINPDQDMTNFKLRLSNNAYAAVFQFDNILIRDISGALPVATFDIKAFSAGSHVDLSWQSVQQTASLFTIERSADSQEFVPIGSVQITPELTSQRTYRFTDRSPLNGTNYYRLRQTNTDGSVMISKIVTANWTDNVPSFTILGNPGTGTSIMLRPQNLPDATYLITNLSGQPIYCQQHETPEGEVTLLPQRPLPSGVYLITAATGTNRRLTRRLLVH